MLNVAIIGCGWAGKKHAEVFQNNNDVKLVAVSDSNINSANTLARMYNIPYVYSNYQDLIDNIQIDLIDICTPPSTHKEIVLTLIEHVPHFLIEKPLARNSKECDDIILACNEKGTNICVCHNRLFFPEVIKAKSILSKIEQKNILIKISFELSGAPKSHWKASQKEGGMLWEDASHAVYLLQHFFPDIRIVQAFGSLSHYEVHDNIRALFICSQNRTGFVDISWTRGQGVLSMDIFSLQHEPIIIDLDYRNIIMIKSPNSKQFIKEILKNLPKHILSILFSKLHFKHQMTIDSHHDNLINAYIETILGRSNSIPVPAEQGKACVQMLEYIEKSIETGKPVNV